MKPQNLLLTLLISGSIGRSTITVPAASTFLDHRTCLEESVRNIVGHTAWCKLKSIDVHTIPYNTKPSTPYLAFFQSPASTPTTCSNKHHYKTGLRWATYETLSDCVMRCLDQGNCNGVVKVSTKLGDWDGGVGTVGLRKYGFQ